MEPRIYIAARELGDQSGHEAGRALLAQLYKAHAGDVLPEIRIAPRGKPYFVDSPWHFSITHTKRHAFCALAQCPIGIDAEEMDRKTDPRLADRILSPYEKAQYDTAQDKQTALLTFWVLKEAQAKQTGDGIRVRPDNTEFSLSDPRVRQHSGCLLAVIW